MESIETILWVFFGTAITTCILKMAKNIASLNIYIVGNAKILYSKAIIEIYAENYDEARKIIKRAKGMIEHFEDNSIPSNKLDTLLNKITLIETVPIPERKEILKKLKS
jgi:hypothetical protein